VEVEAARFSVEVEEAVTVACETAEVTAAETLTLSANRLVLEGVTEVLVSDGEETFNVVELLRQLSLQMAEANDVAVRMEQLEAVLAKVTAQLAGIMRAQSQQ
jgi:hypothetical protein